MKKYWNIVAELMSKLGSALVELARVLRLVPSHVLMLARAYTRNRVDVSYDYTDVMVRLARLKKVEIECYDDKYKDALRHHLSAQGFKVSVKGLLLKASR